MATQYSVTFVNQSQNNFDFCLFQQSSNAGGGQVYPLAWFSQPVPPGGSNTFTWVNEYSFVWGNPGNLAPGAVFEAAQMVPADPSSMNQITLSNMNGGLAFGNPQTGPQPGTLCINEASSIQYGQASAGIGLFGRPILVAPAQPNMNCCFPPNPNFMCVAGSYQPGQVLDPSTMFQAAPIRFSPGVTHVVATLNQFNQWTVSSNPY